MDYCTVGWILFAVTAIALTYYGGEAGYWRMRSREFYEAQQRLIDAGIVKWNAPILRGEVKPHRFSNRREVRDSFRPACRFCGDTSGTCAHHGSRY